jgi:hypothetical protein
MVYGVMAWVRRRRDVLLVCLLLGGSSRARAQAAAPLAQPVPPPPVLPEAVPPPASSPPAESSPPPPASAAPTPYQPAAAPPAWEVATPAPVAATEAGSSAPVAHAEPRPYSLAVSLSTSILSETNATSVVTAPLLEGAYAVVPSVLVDLSLGFGWLVDNQGLGESTFRAGNPLLLGIYREGFGPWRFRGGFGVAAPLARVPLGPDGRLYESIYNRTLASVGMWNLWLWARDHMATPIELRTTYAFPGGQVVSAEVAIALLYGVAGGASGTDLVGQLAVEAELPLSATFALGPRLQTVTLGSASIDRWQSAAALRGILATSAGRFFAMVLLNLDEPLGALGGGARWGFHLGKEIDL